MAVQPQTQPGARTLDQARASDRQETRKLIRPNRAQITEDGAFSLDKSRIPKGFVMEWKRHECLGFVDKRNQVVVRQNHWEPVPHKLQPHILGHLCTDDNEHIIVAGLGLYMRADYLNEDAMLEQTEQTNYVLGQQLQALRLSSQEQVGPNYTKIKRAVLAPQPVE